MPFHLKPDADGGVVFMDHKGNDASVKRLPSADSRKAPQPGRPDTLAAGGLDRLGLAAGSHGKVFITGEPGKVAGLPRQVKHVKAPNDATVSTEGRAVIDRTAWADQQSVQLTPATGAEPRPVAIEMSVPDTGKATAFTVAPDAAPASGTASAPASTATAQGASGAAPRTLSAQAASAGSPSDPVEGERFCAVPRNDPRNQAMQPKPRQVEWAVDQAVVGNLNTQRPANWKNLGMPAYSPQGLFPSLGLNGGGHVPAQIMLGIIAQESNMWQAARYAVPGVTGNPLIGNYYGRPIYNASTADDWDIHWDKADCGYGLTQQTDGMRLPEHTPAGAAPAMAYQTQRAVALDYATNIAAGLRTLQQKWNETTAAGMKLNNGDWSKPENWFYATWAYNSGFHADAGDGSPWGLGWANNPANPNYPANRKPFLNANNYADASHPQDWPYPEKVIGWAAYPIEGLESPGTTVAGFRAAWWNGADGAAANANRYTASPPATLFCDAGNACLPGQSYTPNAPDVVGEPAGPCAHTTGGKYDLKCWYNKPATWKSDCSYSCGNELIRFNTTYPEEADGTAYPPNCTLAGLPAGAMVVDDLPDTVPSVRPNCTRPPNYGTFSLDFARDAVGNYPSKVDFHQLGAGFGGHFSFAHTRTAGAQGGKLAVTGTWKLAVDVNGPAQVLVHLPDHGAQTTEAKYEIDTAKGTKSRTISQPGTGNRWVPLGVFLFASKPTVRLSNVTDHGTGDADIAYDAIAVAPVHGTFVERTFDAVANFSSHQNLDTDTPSAITTPMRTRQTLYDWGHARTAGGRNYDGRTLHGLSNYATCQPGAASADCVGAATARAAADWGRDVEAAGTDTIADWLAFANRPAPTVIDPHDSYTDDHSYKIKTHIEASWVAGDDGKIVPGSEAVVYAPRTGNTEIAPFITAFVKATVADYGSLGITLPDLSFTATDPNVHGTTARIANPIETGITPGQAYVPGTRPARIDSNGTCLNTKIVSGGSIGYRLLDAQPSTDAAMNTWANKLAALADRDRSPGRSPTPRATSTAPSSARPSRTAPETSRAARSTTWHRRSGRTSAWPSAPTAP
ncbi:golvesin C-terminal-like domain-containing protein [Kitasatospora fiedleri]|uniref:golvesin C-terminal-like domain-containing protein n=1 Tax=Kitasatospora fiedleri TaxID=2991545 RepID=UPI00249BDEE7|nr:hypothetical protein [Kitasatospora fiedleri]